MQYMEKLNLNCVIMMICIKYLEDILIYAQLFTYTLNYLRYYYLVCEIYDFKCSILNKSKYS